MVYLPPGLFKVSVGEKASEALRIKKDGVVIRGAGRSRTLLFNNTSNMRRKVVVRIASDGGRGDFFNKTAEPVSITQDLLRPTKTIPVESVKDLKRGDFILIDQFAYEWSWAGEHGETSWKGDKGRPRAPTYVREIVGINHSKKQITIDVPIRYYLKTRDGAQYKLHAAPLREVGIESLAIGNREHTSTQWGESDHSKKGTGAYDVRILFYLFERVRDGWARNIKSFCPRNKSEAHLTE